MRGETLQGSSKLKVLSCRHLPLRVLDHQNWCDWWRCGIHSEEHCKRKRQRREKLTPTQATHTAAEGGVSSQNRVYPCRQSLPLPSNSSRNRYLVWMPVVAQGPLLWLRDLWWVLTGRSWSILHHQNNRGIVKRNKNQKQKKRAKRKRAYPSKCTPLQLNKRKTLEMKK